MILSTKAQNQSTNLLSYNSNGPKPGQCTQLNRDLTSHEYRHIAEVPQKNVAYSHGNHLICQVSTMASYAINWLSAHKLN